MNSLPAILDGKAAAERKNEVRKFIEDGLDWIEERVFLNSFNEKIWMMRKKI